MRETAVKGLGSGRKEGRKLLQALEQAFPMESLQEMFLLLKSCILWERDPLEQDKE